MYEGGTYQESQDIFSTLSHQPIKSFNNREPWKREFNCTAVPFDTAVEPPAYHSGGSSSSHGLPSLREDYADFAQLGSTSFPMALIDAPRGIEFLFGRLFKVHRRLSKSPNIMNMKEFMQ
ncbi:hypothetical protein KIN20_018550, partial [Parelaphostrongylus tenuis]